MPDKLLPKHERPEGYPPEERVLRGCLLYQEQDPTAEHLTCSVKLHEVSPKEEAALLQVFKNNTLAACWILRDIEQHQPRRLFASCRNQKSKTYQFNTDKIASIIENRCRERIRGRYQISTYVFEGLCASLAAMISSWLQQITEADQKGWIKQYRQAGEFYIAVGKHMGKKLSELGRKLIYGYAFLLPKREACEEALQHLNALLEATEDNHDEEMVAKAENYIMEFGPRRRRPLGTMREESWRRLRALTLRELERMDYYNQLRKAAQVYLKFTPNSFPRIHSDGLSSGRRQQLTADYLQTLDEIAALPELSEEQTGRLTAIEQSLLAKLKVRAYDATRTPAYFPVHWKRTDAALKTRDVCLAYDPTNNSYVLLMYLLASTSRYRQPLVVQSELYDVNNPTVKISASGRPVGAMIFNLEYGSYQQRMLDDARLGIEEWKRANPKTLGCIRSVWLHAHYSETTRRWWFEAAISIGVDPKYLQVPKHVVGVHVDPIHGYYVCVMDLSGQLCEYFHLDEARITSLLENAPNQAFIPRTSRTAKERHHRLADALTAICRQYHGVMGVEEISYRHQDVDSDSVPIHKLQDSSRTIVGLLQYKLPLVHLPKPLDIRGVAPRRDCGKCGVRQDKRKRDSTRFACRGCTHTEPWHANAAREVARRVLWAMSRRGDQK